MTCSCGCRVLGLLLLLLLLLLPPPPVATLQLCLHCECPSAVHRPIRQPLPCRLPLCTAGAVPRRDHDGAQPPDHHQGQAGGLRLPGTALGAGGAAGCRGSTSIWVAYTQWHSDSRCGLRSRQADEQHLGLLLTLSWSHLPRLCRTTTSCPRSSLCCTTCASSSCPSRRTTTSVCATSCRCCALRVPPSAPTQTSEGNCGLEWRGGLDYMCWQYPQERVCSVFKAPEVATACSVYH